MSDTPRDSQAPSPAPRRPLTLAERRVAIAQNLSRGELPSLEQARTDLGLGVEFDFSDALLRSLSRT